MLRTSSTILLLVFLGATSSLSARSGGNAQSGDQISTADDAQTNQRGTPDAPFVIQLQQAPTQQPLVPDSNENGHWYSRPDWWAVGFAGGLFVSATGLWIFTALLWRSTRMTAKAIVANERPWVGLVTNHPPENFAPGRNQFKMVVKNFGRSPALKMRVKFVGKVLSETAVRPRIHNDREPPKALFPNVSDFYPAMFELGESDWIGIRGGALTLWIVGKIDYWGAGQSDPYSTTFCARWDVTRQELVPYKEGNDAT